MESTRLKLGSNVSVMAASESIIEVLPSLLSLLSFALPGWSTTAARNSGPDFPLNATPGRWVTEVSDIPKTFSSSPCKSRSSSSAAERGGARPERITYPRPGKLIHELLVPTATSPTPPSPGWLDVIVLPVVRTNPASDS